MRGAGRMAGRHANPEAGGMLPSTTRTSFARASSTIDSMLRREIVGCDEAVVARHIVGAGQDVNDLRPQRDHVRAEPHQHLRRGLRTDAAVDEGAREERGVGQRPVLGDRVADEDDLDAAGGDLEIRLAESAQTGPVGCASCTQLAFVRRETPDRGRATPDPAAAGRAA